jgi:predicted SprT family Zn-dependent metalloprotease
MPMGTFREAEMDRHYVRMQQQAHHPHAQRLSLGLIRLNAQLAGIDPDQWLLEKQGLVKKPEAHTHLYRCPQCKNHFMSQQALNGHLRVHGKKGGRIV